MGQGRKKREVIDIVRSKRFMWRRKRRAKILTTLNLMEKNGGMG